MEIMQDSTVITMFVCANCARSGKEFTSAGHARPKAPDFNLPGRLQSVIVPCTGRLQPEHILKAFESGSSVVSVVACQEGNCHYAEGSRRCAVRVEYLRAILKEIGLGEGRLLLSYLPGSASEDLAVAAGKSAGDSKDASLKAALAGVRELVVEALRIYPPNPLRLSGAAEEELIEEELVFGEDDSDE